MITLWQKRRANGFQKDNRNSGNRKSGAVRDDCSIADRRFFSAAACSKAGDRGGEAGNNGGGTAVKKTVSKAAGTRRQQRARSSLTRATAVTTPGMIGESGINEKKLNLIYAKKLQTLLEAKGYRVVLTRETEEGLYDADAAHKKAQDMQRRVAIIAGEAPADHREHPPEQLSGSGSERPAGVLL